MVREYTDVWNGFQIRDICYLLKKEDDMSIDFPDEFDIVKWEDTEPMEVIDWETGEKKISTRHCFSIGRIIWDRKEPGFEFESCGLRYLEYRVDGLEDWLLAWCNNMEHIKLEECGYYD